MSECLRISGSWVIETDTTLYLRVIHKPIERVEQSRELHSKYIISKDTSKFRLHISTKCHRTFFYLISFNDFLSLSLHLKPSLI
jgi:hypothetical protein